MEPPDSSSSSTVPLRKPLKGCLKSPPLSPNLRSDSFTSFVQACDDRHPHSHPFSLPSYLDFTVPGSSFRSSDSGSSSPLSSCSGANTPATDGSLTPTTRARKNVSFCPEEAGLEQVFIADAWDRTPTEPAGQLSYQDILELKAIQNTLPRAQQLPDLYTGKPAHQYLQKVPIGLLPLTEQSSPSDTPLFTPHPTPVSSPGSTPNSGQGSPNASADNSPPCSPPSGPSAKPPPGPWHSYLPSTTSPLAASALAAAFASKHAEKRVYPCNPIPSNLGPKFVPPCKPHHAVPIDNSTNVSESATTPSSSSPTSTPRPSTPVDPFSLAHLLPSRTPTPMRRKPNFAFLPLLDTPSSLSSEKEAATLVSPVPASSLGSPLCLSDNQTSCDDEPPLEAYSSSSSSSYASDSERESGYTGGSPLSRSASITSVSTVGSMPAELKDFSAAGSAYTEEQDPGDPGFFLIPPSKHASPPLKDSCYFGDPSPSFVAKDPRLEAVASPSLAPPSPLSLDGRGPGVDLAKIMQERLERIELERSKARDVLEDAQPITRTPSSLNSRTNSTSVSSPPSREPSRERSESTDLAEIERVRRERLGRKWTPPPSGGTSRTSSRAPSRERNVVEINGVEINLDGE